MKIIVLVAAKGGVGKSTLAAGVAIAASLAHPEAKVAFIDLNSGEVRSLLTIRSVMCCASVRRSVA